jgi:hypothetical protein
MVVGLLRRQVCTQDATLDALESVADVGKIIGAGGLAGVVGIDYWWGIH